MKEPSELELRLRKAFSRMIELAVTDLPRNVENAIDEAYRREESDIGKQQLAAILENVRLAREKGIPMCQDTGVPMFHLRVGDEFPLKSGLEETVLDSVRRATASSLLRPNVVDSITRRNTGDNTGMRIPYVEFDLCEGNELDVEFIPKGAGSENMSRLQMLNPGEGFQGVKQVVLETVVSAGGKPCTPGIVGVGVGLGAEGVMRLARKASIRPLPRRNPDPSIAALESDVLESVNRLGIGPMGLGSSSTALAVNIETGHTHTAQLPVGIIFQCWAARRAEARIYPNGRAQYLSHEA